MLAHGTGRHVIVEGEPAGELPPRRVEQDLQQFLAQLRTAASVGEVHRLALTQVRRMTGFDRALLYEFDAERNGTVIAEDRGERLPSYLNQRFPAADIPRRASCIGETAPG